MAQNILDKALNLFGLKSPNATDYYDPSIYRAEVSTSEVASKPTKVEQYQQKKNASSVGTKKLSGVAKYLAEKQQPEQETIITEPVVTGESLTGVAKYLAIRHQEEQQTFENMTGVAKYVFNLKKGDKGRRVATPPQAQQEAPENLSRVDLYLAKKQGIKLEAKAVTKKSPTPKEAAPVTPVAKIKQEAIKEQTVATAANKENPAQITEKTQNEITDLSDGATQCQAATVKRGQCSRKTNLETIEQSINQKQYRFAVCSQHNKDSFIPFAQMLQDN